MNFTGFPMLSTMEVESFDGICCPQLDGWVEQNTVPKWDAIKMCTFKALLWLIWVE